MLFFMMTFNISLLLAVSFLKIDHSSQYTYIISRHCCTLYPAIHLSSSDCSPQVQSQSLCLQWRMGAPDLVPETAFSYPSLKWWNFTAHCNPGSSVTVVSRVSSFGPLCRDWVQGTSPFLPFLKTALSQWFLGLRCPNGQWFNMCAPPRASEDDTM